ncbi:hypothetical protein BCEN4_800010 [Burkholderia cenocepacia]|nr:hypothetical protein BCEN4_800010 [Burkholderia cenocepacia]
MICMVIAPIQCLSRIITNLVPARRIGALRNEHCRMRFVVSCANGSRLTAFMRTGPVQTISARSIFVPFNRIANQNMETFSNNPILTMICITNVSSDDG